MAVGGCTIFDTVYNAGAREENAAICRDVLQPLSMEKILPERDTGRESRTKYNHSAELPKHIVKARSYHRIKK